MRSSFTAEADGALELGSPSKTVLNSPSPVAKYCHHCRRVVWTKIKYYPTFKTRMMAFGLFPCLLCWVPFFCHWKAELDHHCSLCNDYLGTYNPSFEHKVLEALTSALPNHRPEERKQPQKKYREVGRRCGEYNEPFTARDQIIRVYSDILQTLSCRGYRTPHLFDPDKPHTDYSFKVQPAKESHIPDKSSRKRKSQDNNCDTQQGRQEELRNMQKGPPRRVQGLCCGCVRFRKWGTWRGPDLGQAELPVG